MTRFYTPFSIQKILRGTTDPVISLGSEDSEGIEKRQTGFLHRLPDPTSRKDIEYYRDPAHRGYLSHLVGEGESPSLFFKTPGTGRSLAKKKSAKAVAGENRIW